MYRNETLQLHDDSIWGRITLLISSLTGRSCTGPERAQFYEIILLNSLEKHDEEVPLQSMIDEAIVLFNNENDECCARKFVSLMRKLRKATDSSEEIIRFLLLLSRTGDKAADKCQMDTSPCCSVLEILNIWKRSMNNHLPTSTISTNYGITSIRPFIDRTNIVCSPYYEGNKQNGVQIEPFHRRQKAASIDIMLSECHEIHEEIRTVLVDERGRVHPRACDPELRSLCKLRIGDVFYIISWHEYLRCLTHVLLGEESFLFRRNADGFFSISRKNKIFLELEDIDLLPRLALPFLKFANRLFSFERFVRDSDSVGDLSLLDCEFQRNTATRALLSLKLCASEQLWKFRDEVRHYVDSQKEFGSECVRGVLRKLLDMCSTFNHLVDIILHVEITGVQNINTLLDIFYIVKITKGRMYPAIGEFCDDILIALLRCCAECILVWLVSGEASPCDGVFCFSKTKNEIPQWTTPGESESISLEAPVFIVKTFVNTWLSEGKFRKLILAWPNLKQLVPEESNYTIVDKLISELSEEEIRKALSSNLLGAIGSILDFHFRKVYLSQYAIFARCCIINDFKETAELLQDVYLCGDEFITEIFVSFMLNGGGGPESKLGIYQNFRLDKMMEYLLTRNYSSILVHGFLQLTTSFAGKDDLKVRFKPPFPLSIIFTQSILVDYERIWNLLLRIATECTALEKLMVQNACTYSIAMMQMRMWNFVRAMRCFFHEQIRCLVINEYQQNLEEVKTVGDAFRLHRQFVKKLYRRCLLGSKHVKLWNVLNDCLLLIAKYRRCSTESFNMLKLFKIFNEFHTNADLFCNAVKRTSVGTNYWLSDLLLLADFPGTYADLNNSSFLDPNSTTILSS